MLQSSLTVAAVQMNGQMDVGENLETCGRLVERAAQSGAEVVVLPENFAFMGPEAERVPIAERLGDADAPIQKALRRMAKAAGCFVLGGGMPERSDDPRRPYNTCLVVNKSGDIVTAYRKVHLFDVSLKDGTELCESDSTTPGKTPVVVELSGTKFGLSICYDLRFPELYRALSDLGAEVLVIPAAFTRFTGRDHWHVLVRARAIEAQAFVIAAAQTGDHPRGRQTYGHSLVVDPWGSILAECTEAEGYALATLERERLVSVRNSLPSLQNRRLALSESSSA